MHNILSKDKRHKYGIDTKSPGSILNTKYIIWYQDTGSGTLVIPILSICYFLKNGFNDFL